MCSSGITLLPLTVSVPPSTPTKAPSVTYDAIAAPVEMLVRHMHTANAHEEWRGAFNQASLNRYSVPAEYLKGPSELHVAAAPTCTAGSDKQEQEQTNSTTVLERTLGTMYRSGELHSVWDMLLQMYLRLEVGVTLP